MKIYEKEVMEKLSKIKKMEGIKHHVLFMYVGDQENSDTLNVQENLMSAFIGDGNILYDECNIAFIDKSLNSPVTGLTDPKNLNEAILLLNEVYEFSDEKEDAKKININELIEANFLKTTHIIAMEKERIQETINEIRETFINPSIVIITPLDLNTGKKIEMANKGTNIYYIPEPIYKNGNIFNSLELKKYESGEDSINYKIIGKFDSEIDLYKTLSLEELYLEIGIMAFVINPFGLNTTIKKWNISIQLYNLIQLKRYFNECYKQDLEMATQSFNLPNKYFIINELKTLEESERFEEDIKNNNEYDYSVNPNAIFETSGSVKILENINLTKNSFTSNLYKTANETKGSLAIETIGKLINASVSNTPNVLFLGISDNANSLYSSNSGYYKYIYESLKILKDSNNNLGLKTFNLECIDHLNDREFDEENFTKKDSEDKTFFDKIIPLADIIVIGANHDVPIEDDELTYFQFVKNILIANKSLIPIYSLNKNTITIINTNEEN